jgi:hypothetical protein
MPRWVPRLMDRIAFGANLLTLCSILRQKPSGCVSSATTSHHKEVKRYSTRLTSRSDAAHALRHPLHLSRLSGLPPASDDLRLRSISIVPATPNASASTSSISHTPKPVMTAQLEEHGDTIIVLKREESHLPLPLPPSRTMQSFLPQDSLLSSSSTLPLTVKKFDCVLIPRLSALKMKEWEDQERSYLTNRRRELRSQPLISPKKAGSRDYENEEDEVEDYLHKTLTSSPTRSPSRPIPLSLTPKGSHRPEKDVKIEFSMDAPIKIESSLSVEDTAIPVYQDDYKDDDNEEEIWCISVGVEDLPDEHDNDCSEPESQARLSKSRKFLHNAHGRFSGASTVLETGSIEPKAKSGKGRIRKTINRPDEISEDGPLETCHQCRQKNPVMRCSAMVHPVNSQHITEVKREEGVEHRFPPRRLRQLGYCGGAWCRRCVRR